MILQECAAVCVHAQLQMLKRQKNDGPDKLSHLRGKGTSNMCMPLLPKVLCHCEDVYVYRVVPDWFAWRKTGVKKVEKMTSGLCFLTLMSYSTSFAQEGCRG